MLTYVLAFSCALQIWFLRTTAGWKRPFVDAPGYKGLPLIGNALMLIDYANRRSLIDLFVRITNEFGPIASLPFFFSNFVILADPDLTRWVLKTPELFGVNTLAQVCFAPFTQGLLVIDGDLWKLHRKIVVPGFSVKHLRLALDAVNDVTDDLLQLWSQRFHGSEGPADVHSHLTAATFDMIGRIAFSYRPGALHALNEGGKPSLLEHNMTTGVEGTSSRFQIPSWTWRLVLGAAENERWHNAITLVRSEIQKVVRQRDLARNDEGIVRDVADLLDRLMTENDNGKKLSEKEIIDEVVMFFVAGHETTANTLVWILFRLAENPHVAAKLRAEVEAVLGPNDRHPTYDELQKMPYMSQIIKESLRLHPVAATFGRTLLADTHIAGKFVEKGTVVMINALSLHKDRVVFGADADVFRPERWDNNWSPPPGSYIPFGHGLRSCPGEKLAMLEAKAILSRIVLNFDFDMVLDQSIKPVHSITYGLKEGLLLNLSKRKIPVDPATVAKLPVLPALNAVAV